MIQGECRICGRNGWLDEIYLCYKCLNNQIEDDQKEYTNDLLVEMHKWLIFEMKKVFSPNKKKL